MKTWQPTKNDSQPESPTFTLLWNQKRDPDYLFLPMRNIAVPHVGHTPLVAGLPFFMVTALALFISFLERHFTQYASIFHPHIHCLYFI